MANGSRRNSIFDYMAQLQDLLIKIDSLHTQLEKLKPLKREDEERLWKKFRLEWNYNSNHIEGNTLTYGQTELLILFGKTTVIMTFGNTRKCRPMMLP